MGWTTKQLLDTAKHIDLPEHDRVISKFKRWVNLSSIVTALVAVAFWTAIVWWLRLFDTPVLLAGAGSAFVIFFIGCRYGDDIWSWCERRQKKIRSTSAWVLSIVGFVIGGLLGFHEFGETDRLRVVLWAFGGAITGGLIGYWGLAILWLLIALIVFIIILPGALLAKPMLFILQRAFRRHVKKRHPEWVNEDNELIVDFSESGIWIRGTKDNIYVVHPTLRRNGRAEERKIPRFTFSQLTKDYKTSVDLTTAAVGAAAAGGLFIALNGNAAANQEHEALNDLAEMLSGTLNEPGIESSVINPTTGLPMVGNMHGGIDVGGNIYGHVETASTSFDSGVTNHNQW